MRILSRHLVFDLENAARKRLREKECFFLAAGGVGVAVGVDVGVEVGVGVKLAVAVAVAVGV